MAAFKDEFSPRSVEALGGELVTAWSDFPSEAWLADAAAGLEPLELLQRVNHIAQTLSVCLPDDFAEAAEILHKALGSPTFTGWMMLPCGQFVANDGIDHPEIALPLLAALSPRFSSENPMRPFIERHPQVTFRFLHQWAQDADEHVRRLVSECTRPRLPWAAQLKGLMADPAPAIELLDLLFDDSSPYVRQSVANHLNDIAKDHPAIAIECGKRWLPASTHGERVVRHGLRTLIKRGDPAALALLGYDQSKAVELTSFGVEPDAVSIGDSVTIRASLTAEASTRAVIDYVVHYQGVKGPKAGKVFKWTDRTIEPDQASEISKTHKFRHVSIRQIHPGVHRIELKVNGKILGERQVLVS